MDEHERDMSDFSGGPQCLALSDRELVATTGFLKELKVRQRQCDLA